MLGENNDIPFRQSFICKSNRGKSTWRYATMTPTGSESNVQPALQGMPGLDGTMESQHCKMELSCELLRESPSERHAVPDVVSQDW